MKERFSQFLSDARQRTARFMVGRNGNDQFNVFLMICSLVLILLSTLLGGKLFLLVLG